MNENRVNKIYIENYKIFDRLDLELNEDINIIVGNNETGKSTILEAINLALTCQLNGKNIQYELSAHLFNSKCVDNYLKSIHDNKNVIPPQIKIELYLESTNETAKLKGTNNYKREDTVGIALNVEFNEEYALDYREYLENGDEVKNIPIEYYIVRWYSFAGNYITSRSIGIKSTLIDASANLYVNGTDKYIMKIIGDVLDPKQKAKLALNYRNLKEIFASTQQIKEINQVLTKKNIGITDRELTVSVDASSKSSWETSMTSYIDNIPFGQLGKGEQNCIKTKLALASDTETDIILIEEPESHLSYSNMEKLMQKVSECCKDKQLIITTHSAYVLNKLGLNKAILLSKDNQLKMDKLDVKTQRYFMKLPGYDTLRILLSTKSILVEGPSDELIVQKAYLQKYNKLPICDGIDVISIRGLAFKRFLEIALLLDLKVAVVTDNDGNVKALEKKYKEYIGMKNISLCWDTDEECKTLEPQLVKVNELTELNNIFGTKFSTKDELIKFMTSSGNKTECALKLFDTPIKIRIPRYIQNAIE